MSETSPPPSKQADGTLKTGFVSEAALKRLSKRHAAERRFRFYGQAAIGIAVAALILLLYSIISQSLGAFTHYKLGVDLTLSEEDIAPDGDTSPEALASNVSEFNQLVQQSLKDRFLPREDAPERLRELYALTTRLAVLPIAREVADNPWMIGETASFEIVLSDDVDLFLKGGVTGRQRIDLGPTGEVSANGTGGYEVLAQSDGGFDGLVELLDASGAESEDEGPVVLFLIGETVLRASDVSIGSLTLTPVAGAEVTGSQLREADLEALVLAQSQSNRTLTDRQIAWTLLLDDAGQIGRSFNTALFTNSDSTYPELAGTISAIVGSLLTMFVTALLALPVGIFAAIYLEEFAPKNRMTDFIEVNINNLAAVPSIVFGLLGAAVFVNFLGLPRSVPLVGGLVLGLLVLPTVIIASRAALRSVPPSIRTAALGIGASKTQSVFHHVLPLAAPGIMTGAIIGMARALGETAPLLLIGMVAFVAEVPDGPTDESTVLPVLIYKWSTGAERAWEPLTAAAIIVLLVFLVVMNAIAIMLRRRFERRW